MNGDCHSRVARTTRLSGRRSRERRRRGRGFPGAMCLTRRLVSLRNPCHPPVKQRLCGSGMKWKEPGAAAVLSLRCLSHTPERWDQFWAKVDRWGFPVAA
jgi:hypothetical protein